MQDLSIGDTIHGFTLISKIDLPEQNGIGLRFQHDATGLDLFQVANDDPENLFAFIFKTPPKNNSGTPHIIEHSVLAGSRRFPTKDPFLSLMKGSANTFLNAMTYPDKTIYPSASPIKKDYYNLLSVYADAVFFPLLRKETFRQEGIRLVIDGKGNLSYDGIVFNEMKGAYSDHDSIVSERSIRGLFPDTPYGFDSGGDPEEIINLTYEEFKGFHAEFYHPSNCRIFLYGDIPIAEQLEFLEDNYLKDFTAIKFTHTVADPKPWVRPVYQVYSSPLNEGERTEGKSTITINWVACSIEDPLDIMALEVLTEALLGNPGAPLYKAIIESGIGSDISSISGMDSDFKNTVFSLGVRGTDPEHRDAFEQLMLSELRSLVKEGIPKEIVSQAIRRIEFQQREIRGGIPNGLRVMSRSVRGWLHGMAPEDTLLFDPVMQRLKDLLADSSAGMGFLENWIDSHLLKNNHRAVVVVKPDSEHTRQSELSIKKHLAQLEKRLNKKDLKIIAEEQEQFLTFQHKADPPEALSVIPKLTREDLPEEISRLQVEESRVLDVPYYRQHMFTNGIVYLDIAFDLAGLDEEMYKLMPLFSRLIYMTGIPGAAYDEVSRMLADKTGGFSSRLEVATKAPMRHLVFRVKMLEEGVDDALELIRKILLTSELWDIRRIKDIVLEQRSDFSTSIIPSGSAYAALRAAAGVNRSAAQEDLWRGLGQWFFIHDIDIQDDGVLLEIARKLEVIRDRILVKNRLLINVTCEESADTHVQTAVERFIGMLPLGNSFRSSCSSSKELFESHDHVCGDEAFYIPAQVGYTALACDVDPFGTPEQTYQTVLTHVLKTNQLWEYIRVLGGAYGASVSIDLIESYCVFSSYRDPRLADTFADYRRALDTVVSGAIDDEMVELSIITLVGKDARPLVPAEKSYLGFRRALYGIDDSLREQRREQLLGTTRETVIQAAVRLRELIDQHSIHVALCSPEMLEKDREHLPRCFEHASVLPL